ncbi:MAG: FAD-binding oxidoreductase [Roseiflexaceae bacterium]
MTTPRGDTGMLPAHADIAIIGGGLTGLACARSLARAGLRVALCEAQRFGWGASSRNGGMVLTGLKLDVSKLDKRYGRATAQAMFRASLAAIDLVEQIVGEEQIDCHFARSGHLIVASKPGHYAGLASEAEFLAAAFGHQTTLVPREQLSSEIGSAAFHGGLVDPLSAGVNPAKYVTGLAQAAQRAGAHLFDQTTVIRVAQEGSKQHITTTRGSFTADRVVVATGGYTGPATPAIRRRVIPIGSYIIATEPLPAALAAELIPHDRMVFDTRNFLYYFRLTPDRRLLFGGRAGFFPETPSTVRQSAAILQRGMIEVFPQLRTTAIEYAWGGNVDFTFDMMPHAGQHDQLAYAVGYAGHGVALATYIGTHLGSQLAGQPSELPFGQPLPGAPLGLYDGRPWFLPFAGAWYKLLDWLT